MQWTDRIQQTKILLVVAAIVIAAASLVVSHYLVKDLSDQERSRMELWAEAMRSLNMPDTNTDLNLVLKVIEDNNSIPVIVIDDDQQITAFRNVKIREKNEADSLLYLQSEVQRMKKMKRFIRINLESSSDYIDVCYDESLMIKRLNVYPYIQLGVVMIFVIIAIFALLTSKKAEQNKVWVGLSKETAHQLGTPISSLMAWTEVLKENYPDDDLIPEMEHDVNRLQLIAERFSKIGSVPELSTVNLLDVMNNVADYMRHRTSDKVVIEKVFPRQEVYAKINAALFEWVVENLCKNAVDAMNGSGKITLFIQDEGEHIAIEVSDTGKGIKKKDIKHVFKPGFTTKKRGWGLGLSLAKRIVEEYHKGRIFVVNSEVGKGTTFRIELRKG
ncbi:MAG: HAMP domain-containing histidine kinase [Prevotella sp.]|nr:HAMP domain-containing histidine kinase [Prevotella sp.]MBR0524565.1 HAMP domain-containing histidine kinase [Prevotella sp.]